jgi:hypothetical protein
MARVITLADFRPAARADSAPWAKARVEESDDPTTDWVEVEVKDLDPVDEDPAEPCLRSITATVTKAWARLVFLDGTGGEDAPSPIVFVAGPQFRPPVTWVSAVLRARTYTGQPPDPDNPMAVLVGGSLAGAFGADTRPTAAELENDLIPQACLDVSRAVGRVPGELLDDARRVAALRTAAEIERSYIPEQADDTKTIYQTLRLTFEEQAEALRKRLQWWGIAEGME